MASAALGPRRDAHSGRTGELCDYVGSGTSRHSPATTARCWICLHTGICFFGAVYLAIKSISIAVSAVMAVLSVGSRSGAQNGECSPGTTAPRAFWADWGALRLCWLRDFTPLPCHNGSLLDLLTHWYLFFWCSLFGHQVHQHRGFCRDGRLERRFTIRRPEWRVQPWDHGATRILGGLGSFATMLAQGLHATPLPQRLVVGFAYTLVSVFLVQFIWPSSPSASRFLP